MRAGKGLRVVMVVIVRIRFGYGKRIAKFGYGKRIANHLSFH